jgi:esterase
MTRKLCIPESLCSYATRTGVTVASSEPAIERAMPVGALMVRLIDWGGPSDRPLLFLHGGGLTARTWDLVCLGLRDRFRCLAVDLRGHGESDWAPDVDYRLDAYAADVAELVQRLTDEPGGPVNRPPVLIGHSLGGQSALLAAGGEVAIAGLVLVDVGPEPDVAAARQIIGWIDRPKRYSGIDEVLAAALLMNPRREPEVLRESLLNNLRQLPGGDWTWKYDPRAFAGLSEEALRQRSEALWQAVARVRVPVLLARGEDSAVFSADQAQALCARLTDCETRVVADAAHSVQGDNPAGLIDAIAPWCSELLRA